MKKDHTLSTSIKGRARSSIVSVGFAALLLLLSVEAGVAIPLSQYQDRVKSAAATLESLRGSIQTSPDQDALRQQKMREIREALPVKDSVEWNGVKYAVDNSWLDEQLKQIERASSDADRSTAIERTHERLQALSERLNEIDQVQESQSPNKAEMRGRLAAVLQRPEYVKAVKEETALQRLWRQLLKWLDSLFPEGQSISPRRATTVSRLAQVTVILIALAAIGYALWVFLPRFMARRKVKKPARAQARVVLGERLEPDKSATDLFAEAEALARNGDLRGAIRRGYIALLIELADRKLISLAQYKTNRDYLRSVRDVERLYGNLEILTNNFELHWYGLVPANESDWATFRAGYKQAITAT
jgi:hypothetical protein